MITFNEYVLMTSAFSDSLMASGGEISETTKGMTMKFLPDVGIDKQARNRKKN